ncbi:serine protease [Streptomyces sp. NPDC089919]|uniref:trypsin-like serine peptidase n=1 Tax=Streptomyces sp. NPDC089919 TaxID=3155188 RepID=UPI00342F7B23
MNKPLASALFALLLTGAAAAPAMASVPQDAAPQARARAAAPRTPAAKAVTITYAGTVALSNCSGSLVRVPNSLASDPALVLSNGHCLETGFPEPGEVVKDYPSSRSFTLLTASGARAGTVRASKIAYGTMTDTDVSIYQLTKTYAQIQSQYGIAALTLNDTHPVQGSAIKVVSGYWKRTYSCNVDAFAYRLKEGDWTWKDSLRYTSSCNTIGGTSGSPVIDTTTGKVVAVNNTGNEDGETCTVNNPCEVDEAGHVTIHPGINYAEETYQIVACVGAGNKIDLSRPGCVLPKP